MPDSTTDGSPQSSSQLWIFQTALVVIGAVVYLNSFKGQIVLDDVVINEDLALRHLWPPWGAMTSPLQVARPLVGLSLALNYAVSGTNLWSYHLFNLTIHLLAALALFGVVRRTLKTDRLRERFGKASTGLAFSIALIWMVHPLQTQSVTYLIQRSEAMVGLFYLFALYAVIRGLTGKHAATWYAAAVLSCAAGMASKPVMATAPIVILIYQLIFFSGSLKRALRKSVGLYAGLAAMWLILAATLRASSGSQTSAGFSLASLTPWAYFRSQFGVIVHYLRLSLWPTGLCLDYGWPVAKSAGDIVPYALVVGLLGLLTLFALKRRPEVGFLGVWFFLILAPTSSVMPIVDLAVEHRMYLSLAAVVTLIALGAYTLAPRILPGLRDNGRAARLAGVVAVVVIAAWLGSLTIARNEYYESKLVMWADVVTKRPENSRGHNHLGLYLSERGEIEEATVQFEKAVAYNPAYPEAHSNLGMALANTGHPIEAMTHFQEALRLWPQVKMANFNLGQVAASQGKWDEAAGYYRNEIKVNPSYGEAYTQLGLALEKQKQFAAAAAAYRDELTLYPNSPQPLCRLALLLANKEAGDLRDTNQAIRLAETAANITHRQPVVLDILASVYSSAGRFQDASVTAQEAMNAARAAGADELADGIKSRLASYAAGRVDRP
jgi:Flp pilus assembly protein TadD